MQFFPVCDVLLLNANRVFVLQQFRLLHTVETSTITTPVVFRA